MSISLDFDAEQLKKSKKLELHYLPAKIDGDGVANVDTYFNNYTRPEPDFGKQVFSNALRGFPLLGGPVQVPTGYKGVVLQESAESMDKTENRKLRLTGTFDEFTYWNYDKVPSKGDNYRQAMQILDVAEALAAPVSEEELQAELKRHREEQENH